MINELLQIVAPHYCYGCQKIGSPLCDNCNYDIENESNDACIICSIPSMSGICSKCCTSYQKAWYVGDRSGALERVINAYKFERVKSAADTLAELFDKRLPVLPPNTVIVPIPTANRHIRQRGYDHTLLIAKRLSKLRRLRLEQRLNRTDYYVQFGQTRRQRFKQAEQTYMCDATLSPDTPYLLVDDVVTTNATVRYAAAALQNAGAKTVWVTAVARQALETE